MTHKAINIDGLEDDLLKMAYKFATESYLEDHPDAKLEPIETALTKLKQIRDNFNNRSGFESISIVPEKQTQEEKDFIKKHNELCDSLFPVVVLENVSRYLYSLSDVLTPKLSRGFEIRKLYQYTTDEVEDPNVTDKRAKDLTPWEIGSIRNIAIRCVDPIDFANMMFRYGAGEVFGGSTLVLSKPEVLFDKFNKQNILTGLIRQLISVDNDTNSTVEFVDVLRSLGIITVADE